MTEPKKIILDTDIGGDPDDSVALSYIFEAEKAGLCRLLGITTCSDNAYGASCSGGIAGYYRRKLPIGQLKMPGVDITEENIESYPGTYSKPVADAFGGSPDYFSAPEALNVLKEILAAADSPVTLVTIGKLSNIRDLITDAEGKKLLRERCAEIAIMGGDFRHHADISSEPHAEFNIVGDIAAAAYVFENSPVPLVLSPFEMSLKILTGKPLIEKYGKNHPAALALLLNGCNDGRSSWDPSTALYAVEGEAEVMKLSEKGFVSVRENGVTDFKADPAGHCRILSVASDPQKIAEKIDSYFK
jgi:inosine-uridine nucleoside N-ribohydrolase